MTFAASCFYASSPGGNFTTTTCAPTTLFPALFPYTTLFRSVQRVQAVRGGIAPSSVPVTVADVTGTNVGSITVRPVVFNAGDGSNDTAFHPLSSRTRQTSVVVPAGFATPIAAQHVITATVSAPAI